MKYVDLQEINKLEELCMEWKRLDNEIKAINESMTADKSTGQAQDYGYIFCGSVRVWIEKKDYEDMVRNRRERQYEIEKTLLEM